MLNWTASAWPILASAALKSTLVLGAAWLITYLLRGRSAAARHTVWTAAAAALVALPLLSLTLPAVRVRIANALLPADTGIVFQTSATTAVPGATGRTANTARQTAGQQAATPGAPARAIDGKEALMLLWMLGIAAGLLQMLISAAMLFRTRRRARVSPDQDAADALATSLGILERVPVLETPCGMPMTFGVLRPTVLLPEEARTWSGERRRVVLLHELAHVLRGDAVTHLLARTALALHWWNPLAWTMWREFLKERERATDDLVLGTGTAASDYAGHLLEIARTLQLAPAGSAGVAMARRSQLEGRLLAILDSKAARGQQGRAACVVAVLVAIAIIAPLAAVRAQSQAQQNLPEVDATILAANAQKNHEIIDQAAVTYEQVRKWAEAQKLRQASLELTEQVSGQASKEYAIALVKLGDLARKRGAWQESTEYYIKALALGDRPEAFSALMSLGRDELMRTRVMGTQGPIPTPAAPAGIMLRNQVDTTLRAVGLPAPDPAKAYDYLMRARNVATNGNDMGAALTWMAMAKQAQPDGSDEAEVLFRKAMATEDADSPEQALTLEFYTQFLKAHDRAVEAGPLEARAKAIHKARVLAMGPHEAAISSAMKMAPGMTAPKLLYKVEPEYSEEARSAKYMGTVTLKVVVDVDGTAKNIEVVNGIGLGLDEKAVEAIQRWKFKPAEKDGAQVPMLATIEINFKLL